MAPRTLRPLFLATIILVVICLFFWSPSLGSASLYYVDPYSWGGPGAPSLAGRVRDEEMRYMATLKARQGLVEKYGPTKEDIRSYPTVGSYTLWDFFIASFQCPHRVERIGALGDGGKWVCGLDRIAKQKNASSILSTGINGESSFEAALMERAPGCQVWGYDFTVDKFGPEVEESPALKQRAHFRPWGLSGHNAHGPDDQPRYYTLDALMRLNGHSFIDVLKIDIEGAEFATMTAFLAAHKPRSHFSTTTLPIGQLQLELHAWDDYANFTYFHDWWTALEDAGLRPFWTEPNLVYVNYANGAKPHLSEYSFINIRGNHSLVYGPLEG
ncbi:methyltransferase domain-containing protein [Multifurca ochricompacta]|uniref:Methyltransferase domain-containing protein n=1 Tax=Multifurca ochricompacta TaxID=376703 RepID=A0AAD4M421_9AGAM|nr:methyltransferase domain-containing protein [Multifurca ochricompacta]